MTDRPPEIAAEAAAGDFVELWLRDRDAGICRPLADYLARFPGHEARIAREYLAQLEPLASPATVPQPARPGHYRRLQLLGQGGQGAVWLAEDARLGRRVALKVLAGGAWSAARRERLRREAQALARLDHPGICRLYEAELDGPEPYLAMRYVEGVTLAALLDDARAGRGGPLPPRDGELAAWLDFFTAAADALHAAHGVGIVHRDVKPGNLMRTSTGQAVVLDFGLARDADPEALGLTGSGELFGTLSYMAPELLLGRPADRRADVYALGATIHEALTLHRPFRAATHEGLRRAILHDEPGSLDRQGWPTDLAAVVATALERDPDRRYATAAALSGDLQRVRRGEPVAARPPGPLLRARRTLVRHPVMATALALLTVGLLVSLLLLAQVERGRQRLQALRAAYRALSLAEEQPGQALHQATEAALAASHPEIDDILLRVLDRCWEEHALFPDGAPGQTTCSPWVAVDDADRLAVYADGGGRVRLVDLATGALTATLQHTADGPTTAVFGPDGEVLTGGQDGWVRRFDAAAAAVVAAPSAGWQLHEPRRGEAVAIAQLAVHAATGRAASCGDDGLVCVFPTRADGPVVRCRGHTGGVDRIAFDPAGGRLLSVGGRTPNLTPGDLTVRVFDAGSGAELLRLGPFQEAVRWAAWSHDGNRLVAAGGDDAVVFDAATGAPLMRCSHSGQISWAAFAPGDREVVTGSPDGLCVFDVATGARRVQRLDFRDRSVFRGAFSADGSRLAVIAWDDTAHLYDAATWQPLRVLRGVSTRPLGLCWNRAGTRLVTVGGAFQTWYAGARPFLQTLRGHGARVVSAALDGNGRALTATADGEVRIWELAGCTTTARLDAAAPLRRARLAPDGGAVLVVTAAGPPLLWQPGRTPRPLGDAPATDGAFVAAGVVLTGDDGAVRLHDRDTGALRLRHLAHSGPILCSHLHPTRPWLATGGADRRVHVLDLERGAPVFASTPWPPGETIPEARTFDVRFSPSGDALVASCEDRRLRVFRARDGWAAQALEFGPTPGRLMFAGQGELLVIGYQWAGSLRLLDLAGPTDREAPVRHGNLLVALQQQPAGRLLLSASKDGTVQLFDPVAERLAGVIPASAAPLLDAQFSPDGRWVITAAADGVARVWPVAPLAEALRFRPARPR